MDARPLSELLEGWLHDREEVRRKQQGEVLRDARKQAGMSQDEFAAAAGISQAYVSAVENGRRSISTDTLADMHSTFAATTGTGDTNAQGKRSSAKEDAAKARKRT